MAPRQHMGQYSKGLSQDLRRTSIHNKYSGSIKITTHLDHISHGKTASGTNRSNRWIYRAFIKIPAKPPGGWPSRFPAPAKERTESLLHSGNEKVMRIMDLENEKVVGLMDVGRVPPIQWQEPSCIMAISGYEPGQCGHGERIFVEALTSDRKLKASREGSK